MINSLSTTKSAQYFTIKTPIPKTKIEKAFKELSTKKTGNFISKLIKQTRTSQKGNKATYSMIVYKFSTEPSFLKNSGHIEEKYAYVLLIETNDTLTVFKKNSESPEGYLKPHIEILDYEKLINFKGDQNPEYEKITSKNMNISDAVIRTQSTEAKNLKNVYSPITASRSIPNLIKLNTNSETYTLTPNTSRITHRDERSDIDQLIDWATETSNDINKAPKNDFINSFAKPVKLADIAAKHHVTAIFIDLSELESLVTSNTYTLAKKACKTPLTQHQINKLFKRLRSPITIENNQAKARNIILPGKINLHSKLITIKSKPLEEIIAISQGNQETSLKEYINKNRLISATFDSPNYAYFSQNCFEDKKLKENPSSMLSIFLDNIPFNNVASEKEKPHSKNLQSFPVKSLFFSIETHYNNEILICDDMNDEWADYISINTNDDTPSISFIHAKHTKKTTTGASSLHEVISQALKNIGRIHADINEYKEKYNQKWKKNYENTQIKRINRVNNWDELETALKATNENPNTTKKIILAVPFIKKSSIRNELRKLEKNQKVKPHIIQLVWLINTFISSCKMLGASPYILCKT